MPPKKKKDKKSFRRNAFKVIKTRHLVTKRVTGVYKIGKPKRVGKLPTRVDKPVRKASAKRKAMKPAPITGAEIFAKLLKRFPFIKKTDQFRLKSWQMFSDKLAQAYAKETVLFCVTVNPDMIHHKAEIQAHFPCQIVSPTEALAAGGFNFIS